MTTKTLAAAALAATILSATPVLADGVPTTPWATTQYWHIGWDSTLGGCFMQTSYGGQGTLLRIGIYPKRGELYIEVLNSTWASMLPGNRYTVTVDFNNIGARPWQAQVISMTTGEPALFLESSNFKVLDAVAAATLIDIAYEGRPVVHGNLYGSAQALHSMVQCQFTYVPMTPSDPFRGAAAPHRADPFQPL